MTEPTDQFEFTAALMQMAEWMAPVREAVMAYRKSLIDGGVGAEFADSMTADYHKLVVHAMVQGAQA